MDPLRIGKKLAPRDRKNGAAHEQWLKRKAQANAARPKQKFVVLNDDPASGIYESTYQR
jgi:hypothetical protein